MTTTAKPLKNIHDRASAAWRAELEREKEADEMVAKRDADNLKYCLAKLGIECEPETSEIELDGVLFVYAFAPMLGYGLRAYLECPKCGGDARSVVLTHLWQLGQFLESPFQKLYHTCAWTVGISSPR